MIQLDNLFAVFDAAQTTLVIVSMLLAWRVGKKTGFFEGWGLFVLAEVLLAVACILFLEADIVDPDDIAVSIAIHVFLLAAGVLVCIAFYKILIAATRIQAGAGPRSRKRQ